MDEMIMCNMKEIAHSDKTNKQRISPQFPSVLQSFLASISLLFRFSASLKMLATSC